MEETKYKLIRTQIGEESQSVSKKIRLQELHNLECLPPIHKKKSYKAMLYMYPSKKMPRNVLFLSSLWREASLERLFLEVPQSIKYYFISWIWINFYNYIFCSFLINFLFMQASIDVLFFSQKPTIDISTDIFRVLS